MAYISEKAARMIYDRLFSKDGVPRYRMSDDERKELEKLKMQFKNKKVKPKARKPKPADVDIYEDIRRRSRR